MSLIADLNNTLTVVLATGDGRPLAPLTDRRTIAAINFGGGYRIIDFVLANCLNSRLRRVYVMTQYNSFSLQNHLRDGWSIFKADLGEFISPVTPPIREHAITYAGSAHVLFHNLYLLHGDKSEHVLICSGEHVYRMDYAALLEFHIAHGADATLAGFPADGDIGNHADFRLSIGADHALGSLHRLGDGGDGELSSMGVVALRRETLIDMLQAAGETGTRGKHLEDLLKPALGGDRTVLGYEFGGTAGRVSQDRYWRNLTSLDDYFNANMDLLRLEPPLDLYQTDWPIRTYQRQQPPARTVPGRSCTEGICVNSIVGNGTVISGGGVNHSVLADGCRIEDGATVEEAILFSDVRVGEGSRVHRAIIDRNVSVPPNVAIGFDEKADRARFVVTDDGVVVIPADFDAW